jgi:Protein of unknown function (DUF3426)
MGARLYRLLMLVVLAVLASVQGFYLFDQWAKVPRENISNWRVEYASLNLAEDSEHLLEMQVRTESPYIWKKSAVPQLEVVLTNIGGEAIAYRKFSPAQWLPNDLPRKNDWLVHGVTSQTEITIAMPLEVPQEASGFQVHLLFE